MDYRERADSYLSHLFCIRKGNLSPKDLELLIDEFKAVAREARIEMRERCAKEVCKRCANKEPHHEETYFRDRSG